MTESTNLYRLIFANESQNTAELIINLLRNQGYPVRGEWVADGEALDEMIASGNWDLIIADSDHPSLTLKLTCHISKRRLPVLYTAPELSDAQVELYLESQASSFVHRANEKWVTSAILASVKNHLNAKTKKRLQAELSEVQARCDLLLEGSNDAIGYVIDGMHIEVNEMYAEIFGYDDVEEIASLPLIDLIEDENQSEFKDFLKLYTKSGGEEMELSTHGLDGKGTSKPLTMSFSKANYDGEDCTQIVVRKPGHNDGAADQSGKLFIKQLKHLVLQARNQKKDGALICIQPWNFWNIRNEYGMAASSELLNMIFEQLTGQIRDPNICARVGGDFFYIAAPGMESQEALAFAEELCRGVSNHIFEIEHQTLLCEVRASAICFGEDSSDQSERLIDYAFLGLSELHDQNLDSEQLALFYVPPAESITSYSGELDFDALAADGYLHLLYQPIVSLRGDSGEYYEVSVAMQERTGEDIDIDMVANNAASREGESHFDRWVLLRAIQLLVQKRDGAPETRIIVNLTGSALNDKALADWLVSSMEGAGLQRSSVVIQLQEMACSKSIKRAGRLADRLKNTQCRFSLADFGSATDSMHTLSFLHATYVKIDSAIVIDNPKVNGSSVDLKSLLGQVATNNAAAIVPHVDSPFKLASLWQMGPAYIQGPYLAEPTTEMDYEFTDLT
ncbi:MAG: EAL domain-containing protein [Pseudomonadales bacterium]